MNLPKTTIAQWAAEMYRILKTVPDEKIGYEINQLIERNNNWNKN